MRQESIDRLAKMFVAEWEKAASLWAWQGQIILDGQASFRAGELKLDRLAAPLSRCMVDNELLNAADAGDLERVAAPAGVAHR